MSFVRIKEIGKKNGKKYRYAYLVENKWRKRLKGGKKGSRQKVGKYLGRVISLDRKEDKEFLDFMQIKDMQQYLKKSKSAIISDLISFELILRGFERKNQILKKEDVSFNLERYKFVDKLDKESKIVIEMNEGFLCGYTISRLRSFKARGDDEREIGVKLAKSFLETGLKVPNEIFVGFYDKL